MTDRTEQIINDAETAIRISKGVDRLKQENQKMRELLWQYRSDMRHPPASDSRLRRIEAINAVLGDE